MKRTIAVWDNESSKFVDKAYTNDPYQVGAYLLSFSREYGAQPGRFEVIVTTTKDVLRPQVARFKITGVGEWERVSA